MGGMSSDEKIVLVCAHCQQPSHQVVRGQATEPADDPADPWSSSAEFTLVQCEECRQVSLVVKDDLPFDTPYPVREFVYPATRKLSPQVPNDLRREFEEAQACLSARAFTASVVMVRRTLEGICKDNGITRKNLADMLTKLRDDGLVDATLAEWADSLRHLGNEGAHFTGKQVSQQDATDALAFAEALLDHIYVLRRRFDEFKTRRAASAT
jgi:hypothetical protein